MLINGAPGSGKSTLARRIATDPDATSSLTLVLDIDTVRGMIGRWLETPGDAGLLARKHALAMIGTQLQAGHDVIVPQFLGRLDFIVQLEAAAAAHGVPFIEVALVSSADEATARFRRRSAHPEDQTHRDAAALESGRDDRIPGMYAAMIAVTAQRPGTRFVATIDGDHDGTYARLLAALGSKPYRPT